MSTDLYCLLLEAQLEVDGLTYLIDNDLLPVACRSKARLRRRILNYQINFVKGETTWTK